MCTELEAFAVFWNSTDYYLIVSHYFNKVHCEMDYYRCAASWKHLLCSGSQSTDYYLIVPHYLNNTAVNHVEKI